jgi:predicted TIM-barrel fold metal-dependent hydrolase
MEVYRPYCDRRFLEQFDEQLRAVQAARRPEGGFAAIAEKAFGYELDPKVVAAADRANEVAGGADPVARLHDMDMDGVAGEVIFHGLQNGEPMPFAADQLFVGRSKAESAELDAVGCHLYNQWLVDFISMAPERHAALAYVSLFDIAGAVKELEWAREHGLRGVNFPAPLRDRPELFDPRFEPFFAACADLEMPMTTHTGAGDRWSYSDGVLGMAFQKIEGPFVARRGVWQLVLSGAFERHPGLKLVLTEIFAHWVPEMLRDMDFAYLDNVNPLIRERIPRLPSEYWMTNCFVGASFMSRDEARLYPEKGTANLMWGGDYPHIEGTHPYTRLSMRTTFAGLPRDHITAMLGMTAARVYGMDVDGLRAVADQIGPTVDEFLDMPDEKPGDEYVGLGFRESTAWPAAAG